MRVYRYIGLSKAKFSLLRLAVFLIAATIGAGVQAMTPKAKGVVTIDVADVNASQAAASSDAVAFPVTLVVEIHSQVAIADLRLDLRLNKAASLSQGWTQWQGGIAAGQTIRLNYVVESSEDPATIHGALCQFDLYRTNAGLNQWLGAAEFEMAQPGPVTTARRVPLKDLSSNTPATRNLSDGAQSQRYLIEYSLD